MNGKRIAQQACDHVTYYHLMFDHHEVIYADGIATESFHADDAGLAGISDRCRDDLFSVFPDLRTSPGRLIEAARPCLQPHESALLTDHRDFEFSA